MYSPLPTSDAPENNRQTQVWLFLLIKIICTTHTAVVISDVIVSQHIIIPEAATSLPF